MTSNLAGGLLSLFAQQNDVGGDSGGLGALACCGPFLIAFSLMFLMIFVIMWKVFDKAGQPGWAALVPIYNQWILVTEICKKEPLWFILGFVPIGNIISAWVLSMELAKKFGKSEGFGIGIFFASPIFLAILAFGDARYQGKGGLKKQSRYDDEEDYEDEDENDRPRGRR